MQRNYFSSFVTPTYPQELIRQIAFHEAGNAAAIYICNQQKNLPPVYFRFTFNENSSTLNHAMSTYTLPPAHRVVKLEGGRLIHTLPESVNRLCDNFSNVDKQACRLAFQADIVNLLAGLIAEAKNVAFRGNKLQPSDRIKINAITYYRRSSDLKIVHEYLDCLFPDSTQPDNKIYELFAEAHNFVNNFSNWKAINALAVYILSSQKSIIDCEEIIHLLDQTKM